MGGSSRTADSGAPPQQMGPASGGKGPPPQGSAGIPTLTVNAGARTAPVWRTRGQAIADQFNNNPNRSMEGYMTARDRLAALMNRGQQGIYGGASNYASRR